jgi:hypothetical protein
MVTTNYKIVNFNEATAQIFVRYSDFPLISIDLPIDQDGNVPVNEQLDLYIKGFLPTHEIARKQQCLKGITNANAIRTLVETEEVVSETRVDNYFYSNPTPPDSFIAMVAIALDELGVPRPNE